MATHIRSLTIFAVFILLLSACTGTSSPAANTGTAPSSQQTTGAVLGTLEIHAFDMGYQPMTLNVDKPGRYTLTLINDGEQAHDIALASARILADPGKSASAEVDIPEKGATFICTFPGHFDAGMKGVVTVGGAAASTDQSQRDDQRDDHGGTLATNDTPPDANAPDYTPFDASAPALREGTVHDITLETVEQDMTVAPGYVQHVWTFNGTVPGPVIRVKVGDTVRVHLKNPATSTMAHSVDFHSSEVAPNDEMTSIKPGEEKLYEWQANYAGVWMYHCGTAPTLHHIANGMYGMVIVEPKEGLPAVDHEFALVQSEWYLGAQGEVASLKKASAAAPAPDFVVFNGVANQYKDNPLQVNPGERVRIFVLNAGPNVDSSFHIVGTIFDTVIKEGVMLRSGNEGNWGSQAVDLAPAQGAIVELTTAEEGMYPMVTHAFNFVGRGAIGLLKSGDGEPKK